MASNSKVAVGIGFALILAAAYFYTLVDWEARAIRQQLDRLVEVVEKEGSVSTLETLGRSRKLVAFFNEGSAVEYVSGRSLPSDLNAMGGAFVSTWGRLETVSIRVLRHAVTVAENEPTAESLLTVKCRVVSQGAERMRDTLKYRIFWQKEAGDWRIAELLVLDSQ